MNERITERQLVTELEHGKTDNLSGFFNGQFEEDRLTALNTMRKLYMDDVKAGTAAPDYLKFDAKQWFGENISVSVGGKLAYSDKYEPGRNPEHSHGGDNTPGNRKEFDPAEIKRVTTELENGNTSSVKDVLGGLKFEEQRRYVEALLAQNKQDRDSGGTQAELRTYYGGTKSDSLSINLFRAVTGWENLLTPTTTLFSSSLHGATGERKLTIPPPKF